MQANLNVDMRVRTSAGLVDIGEVTQETTIGGILTKAQDIIARQFPTSREAVSLRQGKQLQLIAYNQILPRDISIAKLIKDGRISSGAADNFFYQCQVFAQ